VYGALDCNTCHVVNASGTAVGPELSHIGLTWTQKTLKTMIRHPRQISPKGYMPAYAKTKISSAQLTQLVAYLGSLK
jgi:cytochrome c2